MAERRDVMHARGEADHALAAVEQYGVELEDMESTDHGLGLLLTARAVVLELRALGVTLDYALHSAAPQER